MPAVSERIGTPAPPSVPGFFQDESDVGLRAQAHWIDEELGLGDAFLARLAPSRRAGGRALEATGRPVASWRGGREVLREPWRMVGHMLSFQGMQAPRVRGLLEYVVERTPEVMHSPALPPWVGGSIRSYLEANGASAIADVTYWVTGFRFADLYAARRRSIAHAD